MASIPRWRRSNTVIALMLAALLLSTRWLKLNVKPSIPYGLYRCVALPATLDRGMLVLFPSPLALAPWHPRDIPLAKPIAAVAGETVCVAEQTLWIRGVSYGVVHTIAHDKPIPHLSEGCFVVAEGTVFTASATRNSLDSRYYGVVPITHLTARMLPVLTWR